MSRSRTPPTSSDLICLEISGPQQPTVLPDGKMEAKLDRIAEQLKALPLLSQVVEGHQHRLEELSKQIAVAAALVEDVKKEQAAAAASRAARIDGYSGGFFRLAKLKFPTFSGTFPRLWITKCTRYFEFYGMPMKMWVSWASMHMEGMAELWMMTYEKRHERDWGRFCEAVEERFGPYDHKQKLTALLDLRQEGIMTVSEYRDQFEERLYHAKLFDPVSSNCFDVALFIRGLREEIRDRMWQQTPATVDAAAQSALVQEALYNLEMQRAQRDPYKE